MRTGLKVLLVCSVVGILGYTVYKYIMKQKDLLENYTYKLVGFKLAKFSKDEIALNITLRFYSQADIEAVVSHLYLDFALGGKKVGYVTETKQFIIPAKGSSDIPLYFSFNPQIVLGNVVSLLMGSLNDKDLMFTLKGFAKVKSGFIGTTVPIEYSTSLRSLTAKIPTIK